MEKDNDLEQNNINKLSLERKNKLKDIISSGHKPYSNNFDKNTFADELIKKYSSLDSDSIKSEKTFSLAGRLMLKRVMGKASFGTIQDQSGKIQFYISEKNVGESLHLFYKSCDLGDILGICGTIFKTKVGELTINITELYLLTKALMPLPEKFHGLKDIEQKYRQRYLDLITSSKTIEIFKTRTKILKLIRNYFDNEGFFEFETPMLHPIPGGANAKPFLTYHNSLDRNMYLRIAPELYLKRIIIGGIEKVYEINKSFRNEGLSTRHNPEFTMIEFYHAFKDYKFLMDFTEKLLQYLLKELGFNNLQLNYGEHNINFKRNFPRLTISEAICKFSEDFDSKKIDDIKYLKNYLSQKKIDFEKDFSVNKLQFAIFENTIEEKLINPIFIVGHPKEISPLARSNDENPNITDRFELYIAGREIANGFSELNDPEEQAKRFSDQMQSKEKGDDEAMYFDDDYIKALEYGMPPTAGEGIGIDRLVMLLTNSHSIRDVILFPQLRK